MRVMGIDPGLTRTGFGVVELAGGSLRALDVGTVRAPVGQTPSVQLLNLCLTLERVMDKYQPDAVAIERLFFNSNARTAIRVGQASGVALLAAAECGVPVFEYTPTEVKKACVGVGNATKDQVQAMVRTILKTEQSFDSADAADALALAICHAHAHKFRAAAASASTEAAVRDTAARDTAVRDTAVRDTAPKG